MNGGPLNKSPNKLVAEAKELFAINTALGGELEQAYLHVSEHILKNLTLMQDFLNKQVPLHYSASTKLLILTRDIYFTNTAFEASSEEAHVNAGQYFIEHSQHLSNEVGSPSSQVKPSDEPLKEKRSLLTSFEGQSAKRSKRSLEIKPTFAIEHAGGINGQDFFWYQHEMEENELSQYQCEDDDLSDYSESVYDASEDYSDEYSYDHELPEATITRIMTNEEHVSLLKSAFREADNYVMVASYGISMAMLNELKGDIIRLRSKGVGIHFYNNDKKPCSPEVMQFIQENKICYEAIQTHTKFLSADGKITAIGSFNWLGSDSSRYPNGKNGTLVISGEQICAGLTSQIGVYLRQYIYKRQGNFAAMSSFRNLDTTNTPIYFDLNDGSKLTYLATLDAHRSVIHSAFKIAKNTLTICCPFINADSDFLTDLPPKLLAKTANRGVKIRVICNNSGVTILNKAYGDLLRLHRNIEVVTTEALHLKTLIVDDHLIADGSFNWMSASRDETSRFHNCELTMVYEGPKAKLFIDAFYQHMGLQIQPELSNDSNPDTPSPKIKPQT